MGTVEKNPNMDSAAGLLIRFYNIRPHPLYYPPLDKVPIAQINHFMMRCILDLCKENSFFQISDVEKNGDAAVVTKEEVRQSHISQLNTKVAGLCPPLVLTSLFLGYSCFLKYMKLKEIMDNKNYMEFFEDEKELLWKLRAEVREHYPDSLSKLLLITKWNKREDVVQVEMER